MRTGDSAGPDKPGLRTVAEPRLAVLYLKVFGAIWAVGWAGGRGKGVGAGGVGPWMTGTWTVGNGAACPPGCGLGGTPSTPPGPGGISILGSGVGESAT